LGHSAGRKNLALFVGVILIHYIKTWEELIIMITTGQFVLTQIALGKEYI